MLENGNEQETANMTRTKNNVKTEEKKCFSIVGALEKTCNEVVPRSS